MSIVVVEQKPTRIPPPDAFEPPPKVAITPCDPWPRPYYLEKGLRRVAPYYYTYNTYCKERWRGRELLDIFAAEFRDRSLEYYHRARAEQKNAILTGTIYVNGKPATSPSMLISNGDKISHTLHRHEPPVTAKPIEIIHEDDDLIVINKPAGVPVHPAGRYNYNSVVEIMRAERGLGWNPLPCNRLDRLTSGIMFIGKHVAAADAFTRQMMGRIVRKEYVARVRGRFPDGEVECAQPILQISPKLGLNRVRAVGRTAKTVFRRLAYYSAEVIEQRKRSRLALHAASEGDPEKGRPQPEPSAESTQGYSIVHCSPLTGRTHQIRVHLQYLGHPISNDPIYANQRVFGPDLAQGDASAAADEDIMARLARMGKDEVAEALAYHEDMVEGYNKAKAEKMSGELCELCRTPLYFDPGPHELGIYLHARRYECEEGGWAFETPLPEWAVPAPGMEGDVEVAEDAGPLGA